MLVRYLIFPGVTFLVSCTTTPQAPRIQPVLSTQTVNDEPGGVAIWINKADPQRSLIFGINRASAPAGALIVYDLSGRIRQTIAGIDRPDQVDVEYNMSIGGRASDLLVLTESGQGRLRVMRIWPDGSGVEENSELPVEDGTPSGIALYRRPSDGAVFAMVGGRNRPIKGAIAQYRLSTDDKARVLGEKVREFGDSISNIPIDSLAVDDETGLVYYATPDDIRAWHADPDHPDAAKEVSRFATDPYRGSRTRIAVYPRDNGEGFLVCADRMAGNSEFHIYYRKNPSKLLKVISGGADKTDGIAVAPASLGQDFLRGILVAASNGSRNYLAYDWSDVLK